MNQRSVGLKSYIALAFFSHLTKSRPADLGTDVPAVLYCTSHRCRCCVTASVGLHLRALSNRCVILARFCLIFFSLPGQTNNLVPELRLLLGERCGISRSIRASVKAHDFKRRSLIIHAASGSCELPRCALEYSSRSMQTKKKINESDRRCVALFQTLLPVRSRDSPPPFHALFP